MAKSKLDGFLPLLRFCAFVVLVCAGSYYVVNDVTDLSHRHVQETGYLLFLFYIIVNIVLFIPMIVWMIIASPFSTNHIFSAYGTGALSTTGYLFFGGIVFLWLLSEVLARQPQRPREPAKPTALPPRKSLLLTLDKFTDLIARPIVVVSELFSHNSRRGRSVPMEEEPLRQLDEQVIEVRQLYPELNLSQVPRLAVERRSWLEALQDRIQYTRDMRTTQVATGALETKLAYIRKLVELDELATKKEQSGLTRQQITIDKDLLSKRKEIEEAKLAAEKSDHLLRKAQNEKAIRDLENSSKPPEPSPLDQARLDLEVAKVRADIDRLVNPKAKAEVADQLTRKLDAIHALEARMEALVDQATKENKGEDYKGRIRRIFREEIAKVMEGYKS